MKRRAFLSTAIPVVAGGCLGGGGERHIGATYSHEDGDELVEAIGLSIEHLGFPLPSTLDVDVWIDQPDVPGKWPDYVAAFDHKSEQKGRLFHVQVGEGETVSNGPGSMTALPERDGLRSYRVVVVSDGDVVEIGRLEVRR